MAPLFTLIAAFEQEQFPIWANEAKNEAINGTLLSKSKQISALGYILNKQIHDSRNHAKDLIGTYQYH